MNIFVSTDTCAAKPVWQSARSRPEVYHPANPEGRGCKYIGELNDAAVLTKTLTVFP